LTRTATGAPAAATVPAAAASVCAIVPAFNEGRRIARVLDTLHETASVHEIIVVDDGSNDDTQAIARAHPAAETGKLRALRLPVNRGKGAAMRAGAESARADVLVFLDADLIGLTPTHVDALAAPVTSGKADMALGVFRHGRGATDLAQFLVPNISGQRAIRRDVFLSIPCLTQSGFGVELAITHHIQTAGLPHERVPLAGVTHPMKEEKLGFFRGLSARLRMYRQMLPYLLRGRRSSRPR
jgi:hypothetical protein